METKKTTDSVFNIFQYHELYSSALGQLFSSVVNADALENTTEKKKAHALLDLLYVWCRAHNNQPQDEEEDKFFKCSIQEKIHYLVPELKRTGIAAVQMNFGESYYSKVLSKIEDITLLEKFLKIIKGNPDFIAEVEAKWEKITKQQEGEKK